MRMRHKHRKHRHLKRQVRFCFVVFMLIVSIFLLNRAVGQLFEKVTTDQIHNAGVRILNHAVEELSENDAVNAQDLVTISYKDDQTISSISINSAEVNRIRTEITSTVLEEIKAEGVETVQIPLGSLSNLWFFSAQGPKIDFDVFPSGYLTSKITSEFDSAGINQTRHRLVLNLSLDLMCVNLLHRQTVTVNSEYILSETIIVGETPQQYAQLLFEDQSKIETQK